MNDSGMTNNSTNKCTQEIIKQNAIKNIINTINNEPKNPYEFVAVINGSPLTILRSGEYGR
ncbi:hypothetical protein [Vagococcus fluvialis]|uniref:hypothetical protein n=1 Tax=Vagococcus fluvialis TaxID=2738 RepID=UPI0022E41507|nr:hypothetical protein [Vagococcus fluvialis]